MPTTHQLKPGAPFDLSAVPTAADSFWPDGKDSARKEFRALRKQFIDTQHRLYAEGKQKLLIVLQAMDAGGKDGTIRNILRGANPQGVRVASFKAPSKEELAHDYLWRVHQVVPEAGHITVFNRSHYEDVLVVRVDSLVPEEEWRKRYDHINAFEKLLTDTGTHILKFCLHISKEEQRARLQDRLDRPDKWWKFDAGDLEKRAQWDTYREAYEEALLRCSTEWAPWYVIPADQKWYRNLAIMRVIVDRLEKMDPEFPPHDFDPTAIKIE